MNTRHETEHVHETERETGTEKKEKQKTEQNSDLRHDLEKPIAILRYGQREEIRITVVDRNGKRTIKLRTWFKAKDGEFRPGRDGMHIRHEAVDDVMQALAKAR